MSNDVYLILSFCDISRTYNQLALVSASVPLASVPILGIRYDRLSGAGLAFRGGGCTSPLGDKVLGKYLVTFLLTRAERLANGVNFKVSRREKYHPALAPVC